MQFSQWTYFNIFPLDRYPMERKGRRRKENSEAEERLVLSR
jgi:hypothetical protein